MKISELVNMLSELQEEIGDAECFMNVDTGYAYKINVIQTERFSLASVKLEAYVLTSDKDEGCIKGVLLGVE